MGVQASMMRGTSASSVSRSKLLVVTLDALDTLYRFKEPVAVQYKAIALQCGLKAKIETKELELSFRQAFKAHNRDYPNYGKGTLDNPQEWWNGLVRKSFQPLVGSEKLPDDLGVRMYTHFSSGSAYELFPDVKPLMDTLSKLKSNYSDPAGPMLITGVITNSDPRVRQVLGSLGLRVGPSELPDMSLRKIADVSMKATQEMTVSGGLPIPRTPLRDYYNAMNDFDFLATSYDAGEEKPSGEIFEYARQLTSPIPWSRFEQKGLEGMATGNIFRDSQQFIKASLEFKRRRSTMWWIHIGDDLVKDYKGAGESGLDALLLKRKAGGVSDDVDVEGKTITSLEEAAMVISLQVQDAFADSQGEGTEDD